VKLTETITEKSFDVKNDKKNLRSGPIFEGFGLQMAKVPTL
jgi:hypothetical protein